jgi:hypothetical protein
MLSFDTCDDRCSSGIFPRQPCLQATNDVKARIIVTQNRLIRNYRALLAASPHPHPVEDKTHGRPYEASPGPS